MIIAKNFMSIEPTDHGYLVKTDGPQIKIIFMNDAFVRIRASFDYKFAEESYILTQTAWPDRLDDFMADERVRVEALMAKIDETPTDITFTTNQLKLVLTKAPFSFALYDLEGVLLHQDLKGKAFVQDHLGRCFHYQVADAKHESFYGFGEKTGALNKAGRRIRFASKDSIGYDSETGDGLYKHVPFIIKMNQENRRAVGLFYHNTYESFFDAANEISGYWASGPGTNYAYFGADAGDLDIFYMVGPSIANVVEHFTTLTGKSALMPIDALGYLGSTMYYAELAKDCDQAIINFTDKTASMEIPMDGFFLSSGYTVKDGKRYLFYWNNDRFSNPSHFFEEMHKRGIVVSANVKPGVLTSHPFFGKFVDAGVFIKTKEGDDIYLDRWWGGNGAFFDFTQPKAREFWKAHLKSALIEHGCEAIWNDNNEYDSLEDREALCHFDGKGGTIGELKPVMATIMAKMSYQALTEALPHRRAYVTSRAGSAGIGRYAQTWCGDNLTEWKTIKYNISTLLGMGLSGMAHTGGDVGGFFGPAPTAEMLTRWVQSAIFYPRFSIHSANTDNTVTEPWMYRDYKDYIRDAIALRYDLMPYLYSLNYESSITGAPLMRPMIYHFQQEARFDNEFEQFMLGSALLVAPVLEQGQTEKEIYLPASDDWFNFYTGDYYKGGQTITLPVDMASIPLFLRGGQILTTTKNLGNLSHSKIEHLILHHAPTHEAETVYYEDDGTSQNYRKGEQLVTTIKATSGQVVRYHFSRQGNFKSPLKSIEINLYSPLKAPLFAMIKETHLEHFLDEELFNKAKEGFYYDYNRHAAVVKVNNPHDKEFTIDVSFAMFDLIGNEKL